MYIGGDILHAKNIKVHQIDHDVLLTNKIYCFIPQIKFLDNPICLSLMAVQKNPYKFSNRSYWLFYFYCRKSVTDW